MLCFYYSSPIDDSCVVAERSYIIGSCGATIGILDDGSCAAASMLDVETTIYFLKQLLVIFMLVHLREYWSGLD